MLTAKVEWPGYSAFQADLDHVINVDMTPLMRRWTEIIVEGNRRGVLSGVDGYDRPMPPLRYRDGRGRRTANRRVPNFGTTAAMETGFGPFATGLHDNLTTSQYQQLTGPRLAPRRDESRVIKNLRTEIRHPAFFQWEAIGVWVDVVDTDGRTFLQRHFGGWGRLPRYDLRPVRPRDVDFAINALKAFMKTEVFKRV